MLSSPRSHGRFVPVWLKSRQLFGTIVPIMRIFTSMAKRSSQTIRYIRTPDGVRLAWAEAGNGPMLIKAANWLTHLEYEWESPVWRHWLKFFSDHFRYLRQDERGCGMTDWKVGDISFERCVEDL